MIKFCFTKKGKLADRIQQRCLNRKSETKGKPGTGRGENNVKHCRYTFDFMTITYESLRNLR